jgi:hypothetical protein
MGKFMPFNQLKNLLKQEKKLSVNECAVLASIILKASINNIMKGI